MGKHSTPRAQRVRAALVWARTHKAQIIAVVVVVVGLVSRLWPSFPSAEILSAVRLVLGA